MIPGSANSLLLASAAVAGGYTIERSLRFNSADSAYLSRTPASAGNRKTWTLSFWVKRGASTGSDIGLFSTYAGANPATACAFNSNDGITFYNYSGSYQFQLITTQVFRDYSAWYHLTFAVDTTQATASNRVKLYVNGVQVTTFSTETYPSQNVDTDWNSTTEHQIGNHASYFSGLLADIHFIDGQALAPTSFGEFDDNGIWQPIAYSGTYGTNGFHLPFSDNSTAAALGTDTSGNGNDWTPYNLSVTNQLPSNYANEATATASSGTIPNGGTPYWVDILPTNADLDYSLSVFRVHDGSLSTPVYWVGDDYASGNVLRARFDLRDFPSVDSVRLNVYTYGSSYVNYNVALLDAAKTAIVGTSVPISLGSTGQQGWFSVPVAGSPRYIEISATSGASRRLQLFAIEVNGQLLVSNAAYTSDSLVDTPTSYGTDTGAGGEVRGNYCIWNPLDKDSDVALANGNLDMSQSNAGFVRGTLGVSAGKWYWEIFAGTGNTVIGVTNSDATPIDVYVGATAKAVGWAQNALFFTPGVTAAGGSAITYTSGDVIGVALNMDIGVVNFYKNGAVISANASGLTGNWFPAIGTNVSATTSIANFGQRPFAYTAPSGFKALCTANLPAPVVTKPSEYMDVTLYTGNGGTNAITGLSFSPDLVWLKGRSHNITSHYFFDVIRDRKALYSNAANAELTLASGKDFGTFDSNGFTLLTPQSIAININGVSFVAWIWDAGSSTVTNNDGSITSSVRANPSAGFSIVTYTGNGTTGQTVGHGLGVAPEFFMFKKRSATSNWIVAHKSIPDPWNNYSLVLNLTDAVSGNWGTFDNNAPTSSVFSVSNGGSNNTNYGSATYVAYCFAPVAGYSSFGSYTGNGSADGPFVFTNMRPRWILIKRTDTTSNWTIIDTAREGYNVDNDPLFPNTSGAETTTDLADILSNGFKLRSTDASVNASAGTYIYAAFAEAAFSIARAR